MVRVKKQLGKEHWKYEKCYKNSRSNQEISEKLANTRNMRNVKENKENWKLERKTQRPQQTQEILEELEILGKYKKCEK